MLLARIFEFTKALRESCLALYDHSTRLSHTPHNERASISWAVVAFEGL